MEGLWDMHCHLLPGVDDGSRNMEETMKALKEEHGEGVRQVLFTPHFYPGAEGNGLGRFQDSFQQVCKEVAKSDFGKDMKLALGNELMYSEGIVECLEAGWALTLAGSQYLLVEFPPSIHYQALYQGMRNLANRGYSPILAHMERYECLYRSPDRLDELKELGICLQVNGASIMGGPLDYRKHQIRKLFVDGRIHFLGTDSHGIHYRRPQMQKAAQWVEKHCQAKVAARILYQNPKAVWEDKTI